MRYRLVGHSGLRVSELCLGTMTFGDDWGWGADPDESRRIFDAYAEAGGNFIDTADAGGLMIAAPADEGPTLFMGHNRPSKDGLVFMGGGVHRRLEVAEELAQDGKATSVVDLRSMAPLNNYGS